MEAMAAVRVLEEKFTGLTMLVKFFDVAASRRAASKVRVVLLQELYGRIMDFATYDTWKACCLVSLQLRAECLDRYRLDDGVRIVGSPFRLLPKPRLSFDFEDRRTREITPAMQVLHCDRMEKYNWMPVISGDGQEAVILDVNFQFEQVNNTI
jgi:hypothetical protein